MTPAGSTLKGSGTDLGTALVTTVEQTLLDLAHRPDLGGVPAEAAVAALWPLADQALLDELAAGQRLRAAIDRAQVWAELYPEQLRAEIDAANDDVFRDVNNGVYRAGFAGSQDAYEQAYHRLFDRLDRLSDRLESQRSLVGDTITEAGVRLFPDAGPLRSRLPRPLLVQPGQADRDAGVVGLRPRPARLAHAARPRGTRRPAVW